MENVLEPIHKGFEKELFELVCRKVKHQEYCQDIIQEVYLKILVNQDKIARADNISAYLTRLTTNTIIDHYRRQGKMPSDEVPLSNIAIEPEEKAESAMSLADCCLRPFIDSLPKIYQEALVMVELEGMKLKCYAEKAGISLTNAKTRIQRARVKLKDVILQCCSYEFDTYGNIVSCCKRGCN